MLTTVPTQIRRTALRTLGITDTLRIVPTPGPAPIIIDGQWRIDHNNIATGTPWTLTHIPTSWTAPYDTRAELQMWLDRPVADRFEYMRRAAKDALGSQDETADERRRAALTIHVLEGHMLGHGSIGPETLCAGCGGYLARVGVDYFHVNACQSCYVPGGWTTRTGVYGRIITAGEVWEQRCWKPAQQHAEWAGVCPDGYREHTMCLTPTPAGCAEGSFCPRDANLSGYCNTHDH